MSGVGDMAGMTVPGSPGGPGVAAAWLPVRVTARTEEAEGIAGFRLEAADGGPLPGFGAGAHIELRLPGHGAALVRPYSLCNAPPPPGQPADHYALGVLREPASRGGSRAMHEQVRPGDLLQASAPRNLFPLAAAAPHHLLVAGGIGITPLLAMAEALAGQGAGFTLHHATRSLARTPYRARIAAAPWADRVHHHVDDGPAAQRFEAARVLAGAPTGSHLYVCGPQGFMAAVLAAARAAGWPDARLHSESFGGAAHAAAPGADAPFELQLGRGGRVIPVRADQTALQALQAAGVAVMSSCEQGVCGTCLTRVLDGLPDHRDQYLTPEEQAAHDQFLPCCSRAQGARLVLDL